MATDAGELVVKISADIADMKASLQIATQNIGALKDSTGAAGVAMGITFAEIISKVVDFGKESVLAFEQSELAMTRLTFFVGSQAAGAFKNFSEHIEETTTFSHANVLALEAQLSAYGVLPGSIESATSAIVEYAAATGKQLPEAGAAFAKAIQGQSRELKQYGLILNQSDDQSTHMQQTIDFLNNKFSGMAGTIRDTVAGQMDVLKNKMDALKEAAGKDIVNAIGFWGNQLKTVAGALGITADKVKYLSDVMSGNASVSQLAIDKLREERAEIITGAKNLAELSHSTVQLTAAQRQRIEIITREINALKQKETQEKKTAVAGATGVAVVQTKAQQAVEQRIAGMKLEMETHDELEKHIQAVTTMTTNIKIQKSFEEVQQLKADQNRITEITNLETEKRMLVSQQSWEAQASFSDQFKLKLADDLNHSKAAFVNMAQTALTSFTDATAKMIVEGGKFSDILKNLWQNLAEQIIAQILRMIAEYLIWMALTGGAGAGLGFMADGGMVQEPSMLVGLRTGSRHIVGEAGPEMVVPTSKMAGSGGVGNYSFASAPGGSGGGGGGGGGGGDIVVNISGQFLEGSASKWNELVRQHIVPQIQKVAMSNPNGPFNRSRGASS